MYRAVSYTHLDVYKRQGQRSAASIARRLQDPLAELVKIDPKSIGNNRVTKPLFFGLLLLRERSLAAAGRFGAGELQTEGVRMRIWPGMRCLLYTSYLLQRYG